MSRRDELVTHLRNQRRRATAARQKKGTAQ